MADHLDDDPPVVPAPQQVVKPREPPGKPGVHHAPPDRHDGSLAGAIKLFSFLHDDHFVKDGFKESVGVENRRHNRHIKNYFPVLPKSNSNSKAYQAG